MNKKTISAPKKPTPMNSHLKHPQVFELFASWIAMSPLLRLLTDKELEKIGVDDPAELKLLQIRTHKEFAQRFKISVDTLIDWKKRDDFWDLVDGFELKWGWQKTPSVLAGFYRKTVSEADSGRVKLWLQYFKKWVPTEKVDFDFGKDIKKDKEKYQ
jgi:hypothetical protein